MPRTYSTYEAKARFSEILRKVRGGETVYVSYRGREVAEIRPVQSEPTAEEALRKLEERGILARPVEPATPLRPIVRREGALDRFLESRE